ncbi:MAG: phosphonate C-P lyase system protein PhnH [Marinospirillum sp.]|uniref:phosphonate C-P lyase system protein PhnH n=1 Tax=Marinospirillum sp. TaxID=2183934 RepID=UPI001A055546|nr:phosphonate C-P lyase system protein PhnH [Marinospirillum sp.]MBE0507198.1 phosphonate C-P lyase system protein PhnH [Marinospirillum sp.]
MTDSRKETAESLIWQPLFQQQMFRTLMMAFSYPGRCYHLPPDLQPQKAIMAILATLADAEVSVADCTQQLDALDQQRMGALVVDASEARFVVAVAEQAPDFAPSIGSLESPELSATLLLPVKALGTTLAQGLQLSLTGAGVQGQTSLAVNGLHPDWLKSRERWNQSFPMGIELLLCDGTQLVALPRTTRIKSKEIS